MDNKPREVSSFQEKKITFSDLQQFLRSNKNEENSLLFKALAKIEKTHIENKVENTQAKSLWEAFNQYIDLNIPLIEKQNKKALIKLAKKIVKDEIWISKKFFENISIDFVPWIEISDDEFVNNNTLSNKMNSSEEKILDDEQWIRKFQNLLIAWFGHRIFDVMESYKTELDLIHEWLYQTYYDMITYWRQAMHQEKNHSDSKRINTWFMQIIWDSDKKNDSNSSIRVKADVFPILLHEIAKWILEYMSMARYNEMRETLVSSILSIDSYQDEHLAMVIWPQLYKQLSFAIKEAISQFFEEWNSASPYNKKQYFIPIFQHINQLPSEEYFKCIESIIDWSDWQKAISTIKWIIQQIENKYQEYNKHRLALKKDEIRKLISKPWYEWYKKCKEKYESKLIAILSERSHTTISKKIVDKKLLNYFISGDFKLDGANDETLQEFIDSVFEAISRKEEEEIRLRALRKLINQKRKTLNGKWWKGKKTISFSTKEIETIEKSISAQALITINKKISGQMKEFSFKEHLLFHKEQTAEINDLYTQLITLDEQKPRLLHDFWNFQLYELWTHDQLVNEWMDSNLSHCVWWVRKNVKWGKIRVWSLRSNIYNNPNNEETNHFYTIWYDPNSSEITQRKWYNDKLVKQSDTTSNIVKSVLQWIWNNFPISAINDLHHLLGQWEKFTDKWNIVYIDDSEQVITTLKNWEEIFHHWLLELDIPSSTTKEELDLLMNHPAIQLDISKVDQSIKNEIVEINCKIVDKSDTIIYENLLKAESLKFSGKTVHCPKLEYANILKITLSTTQTSTKKSFPESSMFPKLKTVATSLFDQSLQIEYPELTRIGLGVFSNAKELHLKKLHDVNTLTIEENCWTINFPSLHYIKSSLNDKRHWEIFYDHLLNIWETVTIYNATHASFPRLWECWAIRCHWEHIKNIDFPTLRMIKGDLQSNAFVNNFPRLEFIWKTISLKKANRPNLSCLKSVGDVIIWNECTWISFPMLWVMSSIEETDEEYDEHNAYYDNPWIDNKNWASISLSHWEEVDFSLLQSIASLTLEHWSVAKIDNVTEITWNLKIENGSFYNDTLVILGDINWSAVTNIELPNALTIWNINCKSLKTISLPKIEEINDIVSEKLEEISLPVATKTWKIECISLSKISLPSVVKMDWLYIPEKCNSVHVPLVKVISWTLKDSRRKIEWWLEEVWALYLNNLSYATFPKLHSCKKILLFGATENPILTIPKVQTLKWLSVNKMNHIALDSIEKIDWDCLFWHEDRPFKAWQAWEHNVNSTSMKSLIEVTGRLAIDCVKTIALPNLALAWSFSSWSEKLLLPKLEDVESDFSCCAKHLSLPSYTWVFNSAGLDKVETLEAPFLKWIYWESNHSAWYSMNKIKKLIAPELEEIVMDGWINEDAYIETKYFTGKIKNWLKLFKGIKR